MTAHRRIVAATLGVFLLGACQTPLGPPCSGSVDLSSRHGARHVQVIAHSGCHVPTLIEVKFPILNNAEPLEALPARVALPAFGSAVLTRLRPLDPHAPVGYQASIALVFGDANPSPDPDVVYEFPFGGTEPRELGQGAGGHQTHVGLDHFSFDFSMPPGTPVLAARGGVVLSVRDGFRPGAFDEELRERANQVMVLHDDGTIALYGHLSKGIAVEESDPVEAGDLLGQSGSSGYSSGPHLHFQVSVQRWREAPKTIPLRFRGQINLQVGKFYGPQRAR